ncbi:MAG: hypothetical protein MSS95_06400, partial [Bacteroidales bacterium]|nr:hypothetical protein [Bacteroidales bacterium]
KPKACHHVHRATFNAKNRTESMAEQAHFAKYKISLKNNNKESQQVNENIRVRNSKIQNIDYSIIREVESSGVDKWKKGGEIFEISPPLSFKIIVVVRFFNASTY